MEASEYDDKNINKKEVKLMSLGVEGRSSNRKLRLTIDSRAGESVCEPTGALDFRMRLSVEQAKGMYYLAAGGNRLQNLGEKHIRVSAEGKLCKMRMQVTQVRTPLLSLGRVCDEGHPVIFTRDGGYIEHESSGDKMHSLRHNNIYTIGVDTVAESGFIRQGTQQMRVIIMSLQVRWKRG